MTVIYKVILNEIKDDFLEKYDQFVENLKTQSEVPEFEKLITLEKDKNAISTFFAQDDVVFDEYMQPLFEFIEKEL